MKKSLMAILLIGSLAFIGNLVFSEEHFAEVPVSMTVSAYDYETENFGRAVIIQEQEELDLMIQSLNKAKHENGSYEVSRSENYKVDLTYADGRTDTLRIWLDFGEGYDMFRTVKKVGTYKLKNDQARVDLRSILEGRSQ